MLNKFDTPEFTMYYVECADLGLRRGRFLECLERFELLEHELKQTQDHEERSLLLEQMFQLARQAKKLSEMNSKVIRFPKPLESPAADADYTRKEAQRF